MNMAETKLACMINVCKPTELLVLTVDGSPPCLQLHVLAEDMKRYFAFKLKIEHVVIEQGKPYPIESIAVKTTRHLSKVQRLLDPGDSSSSEIL